MGWSVEYGRVLWICVLLIWSDAFFMFWLSFLLICSEGIAWYWWVFHGYTALNDPFTVYIYELEWKDIFFLNYDYYFCNYCCCCFVISCLYCDWLVEDLSSPIQRPDFWVVGFSSPKLWSTVFTMFDWRRIFFVSSIHWRWCMGHLVFCTLDGHPFESLIG